MHASSYSARRARSLEVDLTAFEARHYLLVLRLGNIAVERGGGETSLFSQQLQGRAA
jgi:hypothetical protein